MVTLADGESWLARAKAGDHAAFETLFARYERPIRGYAYRLLGNADDAAELTQETFLRAYRALPGTNDDLNVGPWLHRIAANACLDLLRRRRRWAPWEVAEHHPSERPEDDPVGTLLRAETRRAVRQALLGLSPRHRQALVLREYEGLSCAEIGVIMGLTDTAVKALLFRGRQAFRRRYGSPEGGEDGGANRAGHGCIGRAGRGCTAA